MTFFSKATNNLSQSQLVNINSQFGRCKKQRFREDRDNDSKTALKKNHHTLIQLRQTLQTTIRRNAMNSKTIQANDPKSPNRKLEPLNAAEIRHLKQEVRKENRSAQLQNSSHENSSFALKANTIKFKSSNIAPKKQVLNNVSNPNVSRNGAKSIMNRQTSMVRSKQCLFDLEKKMQTKSLSQNKLRSTNDPSLSTLPAIIKPSNSLMGSFCAEELLQVSFINPGNQPKEIAIESYIRSRIRVDQDSQSKIHKGGSMDSNVLLIHVDDKPRKKIIFNTFVNSKSERHLQLKRFSNFGRSSSRIVDNVYIRSLFDHKIHLNDTKNLENIKSTINRNFEENLKSMQHFASKICRRAQGAVHKIIQPIQATKKEYKAEMIKKMKNFLNFYGSLDLPSSELLKFPIRPYFHPKAAEFVKAAKFGDIDKMNHMLLHDSNLLIYEFDYLHLTALHWASKRNRTECAEELIRLRAYVNAQDMYGRTPLYYAIQNKNLVLVYQLLLHKAIPWSTEGCNYIQLAEGDDTIIYFIKRFRYLDLILKLLKRKERESFRRSFIETKIRRPAFTCTDFDKN